MNKNMKKIYLAAFLSVFFVAGRGQNIDWNAVADASSKAFVQSFWSGSEKYFLYGSDGKADFHYWPQAHALDVMVDAWTRSGDRAFLTGMAEWMEGVKAKNGGTWENDYFDDMEWIGLAMLRAYGATGERVYGETALEVWEYILKGWNANAGGGVQWVKHQPFSKNACSNGPAAILAARLYRRFGDEANREWALKIYRWERETLFDAVVGSVADNVNSETGAVNRKVYTYNQGTFVGAAVELYRITRDPAYLADAQKAADYAIDSLSAGADGLLKDEGTGDGGLFKGILVRYLTELVQADGLDEAARTRYVRFLLHNAEILHTRGTNRQTGGFGTYWNSAPASVNGLTEQLSGCMLIEAAALMQRKKLF
jgi:predicted alpha-1,6-mannanase (GH76 family)